MSVSVENRYFGVLGPFVVEVIASTNSDLSESVVIGAGQMVVQGNQVLTQTIPSIPPLSFGETSIYIGARVDATNLIMEFDETDNVLASPNTMRLRQGAADVSVGRVRSSVYQLQAGDSLDVFSRLQNSGSEAANNVEVRVMLSTNPVISRQDVTLETVHR